MPAKINITPDAIAKAMEDYRAKDKHGKYSFTVPDIAARAGVSPATLVKLAAKRRLKKRVIVHTDAVVKAALDDYVGHPELFTSAIADKYGVSTATLTVWATNAGIPLRSRGLHKLDAPTARQRQIIELAAILPYEKVGDRFGISKARVGAIVKRWKDWQEPAKPPFMPGDIVEWRNKGRKEKLTVIDASVTHGTMVDSRGRVLRSFTWNTRGRLPKKIGVDLKYVVRATNGHAAPTPTPTTSELS